jgi:conjugal transfer pilus assembly protein TraK
LKFKQRNNNTPKELLDATVTVHPETPTKIFMSNRDINRITCMGNRPVKDVIYSKEKGITHTKSGPNAYLKFLVQQGGSGDKLYRHESAELYVLCGSEATNYTLIVTPKNIDAQHVQLKSMGEKVTQNLSLFEGMDFEKKILTIMKHGYTAEFPESYTVKHLTKKLPAVIKGISATLSTVVNVEGEGFQLKIINLELNHDDPRDSFSIDEKKFLNQNITDNPVGISLDNLSIQKGRITRLFILEQPMRS